MFGCEQGIELSPSTHRDAHVTNCSITPHLIGIEIAYLDIY